MILEVDTKPVKAGKRRTVKARRKASAGRSRR
jgi:hypothetical protein